CRKEANMSFANVTTEGLPWVKAELNYLVPTRQKPRTYTFDPPAGGPRTTLINDPHEVAIIDARPLLGDLSLDQEGFGSVQHSSDVHNFYDDEEVRRIYYPEARALLQQLTGGDRVHVFDHTVRRRVAGTEDRRSDAPRQPVPRVHVDHTEKSGP